MEVLLLKEEQEIRGKSVNQVPTAAIFLMVWLTNLTYLRGKAKESVLRREEENLKLSSTRVTRSMIIIDYNNGKSVPSTPAQQVTLQEDKVTQQMTKVGQHNQMSNRELYKPAFEPRITRTMMKLLQDKKKETAIMKLKHETSSKTNGISKHSYRFTA